MPQEKFRIQQLQFVFLQHRINRRETVNQHTELLEPFEEIAVPTRVRAKPKPKSGHRDKREKAWTVTELVAAASQLRPDAFLRLREKLDEVEERQLRDSLARITKRTRAKGVTEEQIDEIVMRRRRESGR